MKKRLPILGAIVAALIAVVLVAAGPAPSVKVAAYGAGGQDLCASNGGEFTIDTWINMKLLTSSSYQVLTFIREPGETNWPKADRNQGTGNWRGDWWNPEPNEPYEWWIVVRESEQAEPFLDCFVTVTMV